MADTSAHLVIKDLVVAPKSELTKHILDGITLTIKPGEVHAIMGPNGSGKTTLSYALMGHPGYEIISGEVHWKGQNLLDFSPDQRSRFGLFLAFQYPTAIPGLSVASFLRTAMNARRSGLVRDPEFDPSDPVKGGMTMGEFRKLVKEKLTQLKMDEAFMTRYVNDGFSGGEKKRLEMLQMALMKPEMAILDETDSGLDIDALRIVAEGVNTMLSPELGVLVITHYQRLLDYLKPQFVHVLARGRIVTSGGPELAHRLEKEGYAPILAENGINPTADEAAAPAGGTSRNMTAWHTPAGQLDPLRVRAAYPILATKPGGRPLHYLDSAATAQRPKRVVDAVAEFLLTANANPHRGAYTLGSMATDAYESARTRTAAFLGVPATELVMLGSATEALNLVARSWGKANLSRGDVVLVTEAEHHANLIPWQQVTREADADLEFIPVDDVTGEILWDRLDGLLKLRPKLVAVGHVSNVLGSIAPLAQIAPQVHAVGGLLVVDGCQAVANMPVNILETGADFYAFSAHKMGGLFSGGGLWARANLLDAMAPIETGGDMIREVRLRDATFAEGTQRFEAGTPDASGTVALAAACEFLDELGRQQIHEHEVRMLERVLRELPEALPDARILGSTIAKDRAGLVSFSSDLVHAHDLATILDRRGVAIRAGHHCAMPLHEQLELSATARVSVAPYTTDEDLDALFEGLRDARKIFER